MDLFIETYFTPYFDVQEHFFEGQIVVAIDVLRASTTVCAALYNGANEIVPAESSEKAAKIYANISRSLRFLGGERNGVKLDGFDAGNSPAEYTREIIEGKTVIFTSTNGAIAFNKANKAKFKIVGCFANYNVVNDFINEVISSSLNKKLTISFVCGGSNGNISIEDTLCAGAFIANLMNTIPNCKISDSSLVALEMFKLHYKEIRSYVKTTSHSKHLESIGMGDDIDLCLTLDKYPVLPIIKDGKITSFFL